MANYFLTPKKGVSANTVKAAPEVLGNLMNDKRVHRGHVHNMHNIRLSPQEQEEMQVNQEKEKKRLEMVKGQIDSLKKHKLTPYDIRPGPLPKIPVDLHFFLTDNKIPRKTFNSTFSQTAPFLKLPPTPKYIPKKTGINVSTQVWDGELFNFNDEVFPIVNVLAYKTIEEAVQEVEEEAEIYHIQQHNMENCLLKHQHWLEDQEEIHQEHVRIGSINNLKNKKHKGKLIFFMLKLQRLNISKTYLSNLMQNTIKNVKMENAITDTRKEFIYSSFKDWVFDKSLKLQADRERFKQFSSNLMTDAVLKMKESRNAKIQLYKEENEQKSSQDINFSSHSRLVHFTYINEKFQYFSEFNSRFAYKVNFKDYEIPILDQMLLKDEEEPVQDETESAKVSEDHQPETDPPATFQTIGIDNIKKLSFTVSNHPYLTLPLEERQFRIHTEIYSQNECLYKPTSIENCPGIELVTEPQSGSVLYPDEEKLVIQLENIPSDVQQIFVYIKSNSEVPECRYARYFLDDYTTSQHIDYNLIRSSSSMLCYRIHRQEDNPRTLQVVMNEGTPEVILQETPTGWFLDIYKVKIPNINDGSEMVSSTIEETAGYTQEFTNSLVEYRTKKLLEWRDYERKKKTILDNARAKGSKGKPRLPPEPKPVTEFINSNSGIPSRLIGPVLIHVEESNIDDVKQSILDQTDEIGEFDLYIKRRKFDDTQLVLRAKKALDLKVLPVFKQEDDIEQEM